MSETTDSLAHAQLTTMTNKLAPLLTELESCVQTLSELDTEVNALIAHKKALEADMKRSSVRLREINGSHRLNGAKHWTQDRIDTLRKRIKIADHPDVVFVAGFEHLQNDYGHDWRVLKVTDKRIYVKCFNKLHQEFRTLDDTGSQSYFPNIDIEASVRAFRAWEASK
jgi:predicted nuclease with TOPRIM domain